MDKPAILTVSVINGRVRINILRRFAVGGVKLDNAAPEFFPDY